MTETQGSHDLFLLLLRVSGVDESMIDQLANQIHQAFMHRYRAGGAFTAELVKLLGPSLPKGTNANPKTEWTHVIRYFAVEDSVDWLQKELERVARENGGRVDTMTFRADVITGRY